MACTIDFSQLPLLAGCPGVNELFIVGNAVGGIDANGNHTVGFGVRKWSDIIKCIFGAGILTITGDELDGSMQYINPNMLTSLVVYYNGVSRYLVEGTEWDYVTNGIQILIPGTNTPEDYFIIFPNYN